MEPTCITKSPVAKVAGGTLAILLLAASPALLGASHTWSGASPVDGNWSTAANWSAGGPPVNLEHDVVLLFPAAMGRMATMNNDLTGLVVTSMTFADTAYAVGGNSMSLGGTVSVTGGVSYSAVALNVDVVLTGTSFLQPTNVTSSGDSYELALYGTLSGAAGSDIHVQSLDGASAGVSFAHANTYLGVTYVDSGYLHVDDAGGLGSPAAGTVVGAGATLTANRVGNPPWVIGEPLSVAGGGANGNAALQWRDLTWTAPITLTDDATVKTSGTVTFDGVVSGAFQLRLRSTQSAGVGAAVFTQANTLSQPALVEHGTLVVTGSQPAAGVLLQGWSTPPATLRGTGTVGNVSMDTGSIETKTVAPGTAAAPGTLHTGNLSLADAANGDQGVLAVRLNGTGAGAWDQVAVTGTVDVTNATLDVVVGFAPAVGDSWTIVANDGADAVAGNLRVGGVPVPQSGTFSAGGRTFQMNYQGGDGNDVVLTLTSTTPVSLQSFEIE